MHQLRSSAGMFSAKRFCKICWVEAKVCGAPSAANRSISGAKNSLNSEFAKKCFQSYDQFLEMVNKMHEIFLIAEN